MQAWILDESPGAYRWGSIDLPELAADDVAIGVREAGHDVPGGFLIEIGQPDSSPLSRKPFRACAADT